jgi:hypothetical protein
MYVSKIRWQWNRAWSFKEKLNESLLDQCAWSVLLVLFPCTLFKRDGLLLLPCLEFRMEGESRHLWACELLHPGHVICRPGVMSQDKSQDAYSHVSHLASLVRVDRVASVCCVPSVKRPAYGASVLCALSPVPSSSSFHRWDYSGNGRDEKMDSWKSKMLAIPSHFTVRPSHVLSLTFTIPF